jgi:ribosomal protein S18 acetylase RimI-like enzyme
MRYEVDTMVVAPYWIKQVQIRQLEQTDLPALEWDGEFSHFRRLFGEIFQSMRNRRAVMWGADLYGIGLIGQVFVQLDSARPEMADGFYRAYFYGFRIKPAYRGEGLGALMLKIAENDLLQRKFSLATLNVGQDNHDALRFYERHGYRVVTEDPGRWSYVDELGLRHEVHEPAWRMEKRLMVKVS